MSGYQSIASEPNAVLYGLYLIKFVLQRGATIIHIMKSIFLYKSPCGLMWKFPWHAYPGAELIDDIVMN